MAYSKCPHCNGLRFEVKLVEPQDGRYKQYFVQCSGCGTPFGVLDYFNTGSQLEDVKKQVGALSDGIGELAGRLQRVEQLLQRSR